MQIVKKGDTVFYYRSFYGRRQVINLTMLFGSLVSEALYQIDQKSPGAGASYVEGYINLRTPKLDRKFRRLHRRVIRKIKRLKQKERN